MRSIRVLVLEGLALVLVHILVLEGLVLVLVLVLVGLFLVLVLVIGVQSLLTSLIGISTIYSLQGYRQCTQAMAAVSFDLLRPVTSNKVSSYDNTS